MELRTERIDSAVILHLEGRMSADGGSVWIRNALDTATERGVRHALLDLGHVSLLDCTGIGQLLRLREQVHGARRTFGLVDVERRQKHMLEVTGLLHVFRVFNDCAEATAVLGIGSGRHPFRPAEPPVPARNVTLGRVAACLGAAAAML